MIGGRQPVGVARFIAATLACGLLWPVLALSQATSGSQPAPSAAAASSAVPSATVAAPIQATPIAGSPATYPVRPVRIIVPTTAGGTTDAVARDISQELSQRLGQPVLIENRAGAGAQIGIDVAGKANADGYVLLVVSNSILPVLKKVVPYDPARDFTPIALIARSPIVYVVPAALSAANLSDFLARAKANPNAIRYGSAGVGSALHLSVELLGSVTGTEMLHVPYIGGAPMMLAVVAGEVEMAPTSPDFARRYMDSRQLRSLAQTGATRLPLLAEVPTTAELGYPEVDVLSWFGLFGPAHLPPEITQRLARDVAAVVEMPAVKQRLAVVGAESAPSTPESFTRYVASENARWTKVVQAAHIPLQD